MLACEFAALLAIKFLVIVIHFVFVEAKPTGVTTIARFPWVCRGEFAVISLIFGFIVIPTNLLIFLFSVGGNVAVLLGGRGNLGECVQVAVVMELAPHGLEVQ